MKREKTKINSALLRDLEGRLGASNIYDWIEGRTTELARLGWRRSGWIDFRPRLLAAANIDKIRIVEASEIDGEACLRPTTAGKYEILYRQVFNWEHERFWIAHEISHSFWLKPGTAAQPLSSLQKGFGADPTIEHLCNYSAGALLLPKRLLEILLDSLGVRLGEKIIQPRAIPLLAEKLHLPWQAVAHRWLHDLMELPLSVVFIKIYSDQKLHVSYEVGPRNREHLTYGGKTVNGAIVGQVKEMDLERSEVLEILGVKGDVGDLSIAETGHRIIKAQTDYILLVWRL